MSTYRYVPLEVFQFRALCGRADMLIHFFSYPITTTVDNTITKSYWTTVYSTLSVPYTTTSYSTLVATTTVVSDRISPILYLAQILTILQEVPTTTTQKIYSTATVTSVRSREVLFVAHCELATNPRPSGLGLDTHHNLSNNCDIVKDYLDDIVFDHVHPVYEDHHLICALYNDLGACLILSRQSRNCGLITDSSCQIAWSD